MAKTKIDIKTEGSLAFKSTCRDARSGGPGMGGPAENPYKPDSWQANAWSDGYRAAKQAAGNVAAEAGRGQSASDYRDLHGDITGTPTAVTVIPDKVLAVDVAFNQPRDTAGGISIPFPARMPSATREHIRCLEADLHHLAGNAEGSTLVRYSKKIEALYARWQ